MLLKRWGYLDMVLDLRGHARRTSLGTTAVKQTYKGPYLMLF